MSRENWFRVLDEAAGCDVRRVQLIGGELTMHPDAPELVDRAVSLGLAVEVYTNLVHISANWWSTANAGGWWPGRLQSRGDLMSVQVTAV